MDLVLIQFKRRKANILFLIFLSASVVIIAKRTLVKPKLNYEGFLCFLENGEYKFVDLLQAHQHLVHWFYNFKIIPFICFLQCQLIFHLRQHRESTLSKGNSTNFGRFWRKDQAQVPLFSPTLLKEDFVSSYYKIQRSLKSIDVCLIFIYRFIWVFRCLLGAL